MTTVADTRGGVPRGPFPPSPVEISHKKDFMFLAPPNPAAGSDAGPHNIIGYFNLLKIRGGYRISRRRLFQVEKGCQPVTWPIFPENCRKVDKLDREGVAPLDLPLKMSKLPEVAKNAVLYRSVTDFCFIDVFFFYLLKPLI